MTASVWSATAAVVVVAFGLLLIAFAGVAIARPAPTRRFLMGFATSARTHYAEQAVRILVGAALVEHSSAMWQSKMFRVIGWMIVVSSVALMCIPWKWHHRLGERMKPMLLRYLGLYVAGAFVFGLLLLYGALARDRSA